MSILEIVLTAVIGLLVLVAVFYLVGDAATKRFKKHKKEHLTVLQPFTVTGGTVFLGDSLTDFYPIQEFFPDRTIFNRGIAGDTTADVSARLDDVIALKPTRIFLQIGINDIIYGARVTAAQLVQRTAALIDRLQKECEGVKIYMISLYPINRKATFISPFICRNASKKRIETANEAYRAYAKEKGLPFIDVYADLQDEKGNLRKNWTVEGLHLSINGYVALSRLLQPYVDDSVPAKDDQSA